jgi:hypothetical protein
MKKIIFSLVSLGVPIFGFSQSNSSAADSTKKTVIPSAVQAAANNTVLGPSSNTPVKPATEQLKDGEQPETTTTTQTAPRSAVELMEQMKQQKAANQQPAQQQTAPH